MLYLAYSNAISGMYSACQTFPTMSITPYTLWPEREHTITVHARYSITVCARFSITVHATASLCMPHLASRWRCHQGKQSYARYSITEYARYSIRMGISTRVSLPLGYAVTFANPISSSPRQYSAYHSTHPTPGYSHSHDKHRNV